MKRSIIERTVEWAAAEAIAWHHARIAHHQRQIDAIRRAFNRRFPASRANRRLAEKDERKEQ